MIGSQQATPKLRTQFKAPEGRYCLRQTIVHAAQKQFSAVPRPAKLSFIPKESDRKSSKDGQALQNNDAEEEPMEKYYMIVNVGDSIYFHDIEDPEKDALESLRLRATPCCHEFNPLSGPGDKIEVLIGFVTGDILVHRPIGKTSTSFNKDGCNSSSRAMSVRWVPKSANLFVSAHADGNLLLYDTTKDKDEQPLPSNMKDEHTVYVQHNKSGKMNPVCRWHICKTPITDIAFSSDGKYLAVVSRDATLRVFHWHDETLLVAFKSYFGALLCVCWSPDSKYVLTGGEDDLLTVWAPKERLVVCRGQGHQSWVSSVAFDVAACDVDNHRYRLGSVGEDARLLLWDFSLDTLHVPKKAPCRRESITLASGRTTSTGVVVPAPGRKEVPLMFPTTDIRVHNDPLSALAFLPHSIFTACHAGSIKIWARPSPHKPSQIDPVVGIDTLLSRDNSWVGASTSAATALAPLATNANTASSAASSTASGAPAGAAAVRLRGPNADINDITLDTPDSPIGAQHKANIKPPSSVVIHH